MNKEIKAQILFALEDDNEVMQAALDSDLDEENKRMNRALIKRHEAILVKVRAEQALSDEDWQLVQDANRMDLNDAVNIRGRHRETCRLERWLDIQMSKKPAFGESGRCRKALAN